MNKKLVAAALGLAFAAPVFADSSNVTLYGRVHQAIEHNSVEAKINGVDQNLPGNGSNIANYSSRLGVRGQEDLGGGLSAIFAYEFGVNADNLDNGASSPLSGRHSYVGLAGSFGKVMIGTLDGGNDSTAPLYNQASKYLLNGQNNAGSLTIVGSAPVFDVDAFITPTSSSFALVNRDQRVNNAIGYSGNIAGVAITARHALNGANSNAGDLTAVENRARSTEIAADYTMGALTFGGGIASYDYATGEESGEIDRTIQLGVSYKFGAFTLAGLYGTTDFNREVATGADAEVDEFGISGAYNLTANSGITAAYVMTDAEFTEPGVATEKADGDQFQIMYFYDFSKRTRVYTGVNRTTIEEKATNSDVEATSYVIGLRHNF